MAKEYRYSLRKDNNTYYKVVNGQVDTQSTPYYFTEGISNFKELGLYEERNVRMSGFYRNISQNVYPFVGDMAKIVRHLFFAHDTQDVCILRVERLSEYRTATYVLDYESQINFAKCIPSRDQTKTELLQGDVEELIKSREDSPYKVTPSGDGWVTINILPFRARGRCVFTSFKAPASNLHAPNRICEQYNWPGYAYQSEDMLEVLESPSFRPVDYFAPLAEGVSTVVEFGQQYNELPLPSSFEGYILKVNVNLLSVKIKLDMPIYIKNLNGLGNSTTANLKIFQADTSGPANFTPVAQASNPVTVADGADTTHVFNIDATFSVDAGKVIHIILERDSTTDVEWQYEEGVTLKIDFEHYTSEFQVKGKNWYHAGKDIAKQLVDGKAQFKSDLLTTDVSYKDGIDCKPTHIALLSSDSIKGVTNPKIPISWSDYLKATDVFFCAGCGVERTRDVNGNVDAVLRLEKRSHFYQETVKGQDNLIAELGQPSNTPEQTLPFYFEGSYNELHIGSSPGNTDDLNGAEDPHTTLKMQTSYTKDKGTNDLVSPVSASGLEIYRKYIRHATGQDNDTGGNDNQLFALQYAPTQTNGVHSALYPTHIVQGPYVSGVTDTDRVLNIGLTPKRCLWRRIYYEIGFFKGEQDPYSSYALKFLTLDKNESFDSQLSTVFRVIEGKPYEYMHELLSQLKQSRLFWPIVIDGHYEAPKNIRELWESNRNGYMSVMVDGVERRGFPMSLEQRNTVPKLHNFKLMLTASQNPADLE